MIYGYARVSTKEQNEDRQLMAFEGCGYKFDRIYIDKQSGKDFNRSEYRKMMRRIRRNDIIIIKSIDRLGRNYSEIIEQWRVLTKVKKADIIVLDMPILDTTANKDLLGTFISDLVLQLLSYAAENERINIRQRQAEGIAAAKVRGVKFGRPEKPLPENFYDVHKRWRNKELTLKQAAEECNLPPTTFFNKSQQFEKSLSE